MNAMKQEAPERQEIEELLPWHAAVRTTCRRGTLRARAVSLDQGRQRVGDTRRQGSRRDERPDGRARGSEHFSKIFMKSVDRNVYAPW